MQVVGKFEKVSYETFTNKLPIEVEGAEARKDIYKNLQLPTRATSGSSGYDFKAPYTFTVSAGGSVLVPTFVRVWIQPGWWLACVPKSGLGFKHRIGLANTIGVIDSDFYYSDDGGMIMAKVVNNGDADVTIQAGKGFMQGIFIPYGVVEGDDVTAVRNGGFGSTEA